MQGRTAVSILAEKNLADPIHVLLERGADGNKPNMMGETPIMLACREGAVDALAVLLQHGCKTHYMSSTGELALHTALDCGQYYCAESK